MESGCQQDETLTFDTKNEIIILSSAEQRCPQS
jgi:hypothetical protein